MKVESGIEQERGGEEEGEEEDVGERALRKGLHSGIK